MEAQKTSLINAPVSCNLNYESSDRLLQFIPDSRCAIISCHMSPDFTVKLPSGIAENIQIVAIEPNHLYCDQELTNGQSVYYYLTKLQINTAYEFRISYSAMVPTNFMIKDLNKTTASGRKLLNIEKVAFWTLMEQEKHFEVTAIRDSVPITSNLNDLPVQYDVVVEQLYGSLPINVWKLVLFASVTIFLVLKFCSQAFINYINDVNEKLE